jgi:hypothetical protein
VLRESATHLNGQQPRKLAQQRPAVARGTRGSCRCEEAASGGAAALPAAVSSARSARK